MSGNKVTLYTTTLLTAIGFMLIGYDNVSSFLRSAGQANGQGVMGGVIDHAPFRNTFFGKSADPMKLNDSDTVTLGTIVSIYEIGCFFGAVITAFIGEMLGRKKSILIGAVIMLGGAGFQAGVSSIGPMIAARVVSGLGMVSWISPRH